MNGPIGRVHPFTPAAVALALIAMAFIVPAGMAASLFVLTCVVAIAVGAGSGVRAALFIMIPIWLLLLVLQGIFGDGDRVSAPWGGTLSASGLVWAFSQGSRLALITTASLTFAASFNPHRFLQASIDRGWPFAPAYLLVATLDAARTLGEQARRLREAQRTRGVRVSGSIAVRIGALPALIFPLLLASLTEADDRALALETRGMMLTSHRYAIDPPRDSAFDRVTRWVSLIMVVAALYWRIRG